MSVATGLARGLDAVAQRRRAQEIEDERIARERDRHDLGMEQSRHGLEVARRDAAWREEDRPLERGEKELGLDDARRKHNRAAVVDGQADADRATKNTREAEDRDRLMRQADEEGVLDWIRTFDKTQDADLAAKAFDAKGRSKIKRHKVTPDGAGDFDVEIEESDGDVTREKWSTLKKLLPQQAPIKLGKDDRLVAPGKDGALRDLTPPAADGSARGGGSEYSKFGPGFFRDSSERYFGRQDPKTGGIIWEEGGREKAAKASSLAERLYRDHNVDPNEAVRLANMSLGFDLSDAEAMLQLREEHTRNQLGGDADDYAKTQLEAFKAKANTAKSEVDRILRGSGAARAPADGKAAKPAGSGYQLVEGKPSDRVSGLLAGVPEGKLVRDIDESVWVKKDGKIHRVTKAEAGAKGK